MSCKKICRAVERELQAKGLRADMLMRKYLGIFKIS
jgi:hypothetical protein